MTTKRLLPPSFFAPLPILCIWGIPMLALLLSNLSDWQLVRENLDQEACRKAYGIGLWNLVQCLLPAVSLVWFYFRKKSPTRPLFTVMLLSQLGFVIFAFIQFPTPEGVEDWIFSPIIARLTQLAGTMPAVFYATLYFASFPPLKKRMLDLLSCVLGMVLPPALAYGAGMLAKGWVGWFFGRMDALGQFGLFLLTLLPVALTFVMGLFLLRFITLSFLSLRSRPALRDGIMPLLIALVLPVCGLLLNRAIPFPVDFQVWEVYALTVVNACLLMLPARGRWARWAWAARCACLPFTLYFFILFLPFLPLSIPAILAAGGGFLILAPTFLFLLHLLRLKEAFSACRENTATKGACGAPFLWTVGLVAFLALPGWIICDTARHREALIEGLDYVFAPDSGSPMRFEKAAQVVRSLDWLKEYKEGLYYPLLTPLRAKILFNGMVLPDERMNALYAAFGSNGANKVSNVRFKNSPTAQRRFERRVSAEDSLSTAPLAVSTQSIGETSGTMVFTHTRIQLENNASLAAEFSARLKLSPGVQIAGARLIQGRQTLTAEIFEEKAALWIYRMIRQSQRDPLLLRYIGADTVQVMAFPVPPCKSTCIEIDFVHPDDLPAEVTLIEKASGSLRRHALFSEFGGGGILVSGSGIFAATGERARAFLCADWASRIPVKAVERKPVLHLLFDTSQGGICTLADVRGALASLAVSQGDTQKAVLYWLNYQMTPLEGGTEKSLAQWAEYFNNPVMVPAAQGGLLFENAALHIGYDYLQRALRKEGDFMRYPRIVLLTRQSPKNISMSARYPFAFCMPESPLPQMLQVASPALEPPETVAVKFVASNDHVLPVRERPNRRPAPMKFADGSVKLVYSACMYTPDETLQLLYFPEGSDHPQYWDADAQRWNDLPTDSINPFHNDWAQGLLNAQRAEATRENPSTRQALLPEILAAARKTRVLAPFTAYMAVETTAQKEKLKRTETQALDSPGELTFSEMPEPSMIFLGAGALALGWWATRRRRAV